MMTRFLWSPRRLELKFKEKRDKVFRLGVYFAGLYSFSSIHKKCRLIIYLIVSQYEMVIKMWTQTTNTHFFYTIIFTEVCVFFFG